MPSAYFCRGNLPQLHRPQPGSESLDSWSGRVQYSVEEPSRGECIKKKKVCAERALSAAQRPHEMDLQILTKKEKTTKKTKWSRNTNNFGEVRRSLDSTTAA